MYKFVKHLIGNDNTIIVLTAFNVYVMTILFGINLIPINHITGLSLVTAILSSITSIYEWLIMKTIRVYIKNFILANIVGSLFVTSSCYLSYMLFLFNGLLISSVILLIITSCSYLVKKL
jgi:hypothetical protein